MAGTYNAFLMAGRLAADFIVYLCRHITSDWVWRSVVVAQIAIPFIKWLSLPTLRESPYWLMQRGRLDEADVNLSCHRAISLTDAKVAIALLHQQQHQLQSHDHQSASSWSACFTDRINLHRTVIAVGAQVFQRAQGISFVAKYQAVFLQQIGFRQVLLMSVIVYVNGIVGNLAGVAITDRLGRRYVLLFLAALLSACLLTIGGLTARSTDNYGMQVGAVIMLMLWFFTFQGIICQFNAVNAIAS